MAVGGRVVLILGCFRTPDTPRTPKLKKKIKMFQKDNKFQQNPN